MGGRMVAWIVVLATSTAGSAGVITAYAPGPAGGDDSGLQASAAGIAAVTAAHDCFRASLASSAEFGFEDLDYGTTLDEATMKAVAFGSVTTGRFDPLGPFSSLTPFVDDMAEYGGDETDGHGRYTIAGSRFVNDLTSPGFAITFATPVTAFGFYAVDVGDYGEDLWLDLAYVGGGTGSYLVREGEVITHTTQNGKTGGGLLFFGLTAGQGITSVALRNEGSGDAFAFDGFVAGQAVPEPGTMALLACGILALRRRRYQHSGTC